MNPNAAFSASLLVSLVLWLPSLLAALRGEVDTPAAGLRYLAALFLSRFAVGGVARLLSAYRSAATVPPPAPAQPEAPRRRKEDREEADAA
jgi:hypothetical protein